MPGATQRDDEGAATLLARGLERRASIEGDHLTGEFARVVAAQKRHQLADVLRAVPILWPSSLPVLRRVVR